MPCELLPRAGSRPTWDTSSTKNTCGNCSTAALPGKTMFSLKGLLKYSATPAGVILIAVVVIQALLSRNAKLKKEVEQLHNEIITQRMLTAALKDSLKNIGDYHPLPETVKVTVPTPAVTETGTPKTWIGVRRKF